MTRIKSKIFIFTLITLFFTFPPAQSTGVSETPLVTTQQEEQTSQQAFSLIDFSKTGELTAFRPQSNQLVLVVIGENWKLPGKEEVQMEAFKILANALSEKASLDSGRVVYESTENAINKIQELRKEFAQSIQIVTYCYGNDSESVNAIITKLPHFLIDCALQINPSITDLDLTRIKKLYAIYSKVHLNLTDLMRETNKKAAELIKSWIPSTATVATVGTGAVAGFVAGGTPGAILGGFGGAATKQASDTAVTFGKKALEKTQKIASLGLYASKLFFSTMLSSDTTSQEAPFMFKLPGKQYLQSLTSSDRKYKQQAILCDGELYFPIKNIRLLSFDGEATATDFNEDELRESKTISLLPKILEEANAFEINFDLMTLISETNPPLCLVYRPVSYNTIQQEFLIHDGSCEYKLFGLETNNAAFLYSEEVYLSTVVTCERIVNHYLWASPLLEKCSQFSLPKSPVTPTRTVLTKAVETLGLKDESRTPNAIKDECLKLMWRPVNRWKQTPLHLGAMLGKLNFNQLLDILNGAGSEGLEDSTIPDMFGNNPLHGIAMHHVSVGMRRLDSISTSHQQEFDTSKDSKALQLKFVNELDETAKSLIEEASTIKQKLQEQSRFETKNKLQKQTPSEIVKDWHEHGIEQQCNTIYEKFYGKYDQQSIDALRSERVKQIENGNTKRHSWWPF